MKTHYFRTPSPPSLPNFLAAVGQKMNTPTPTSVFQQSPFALLTLSFTSTYVSQIPLSFPSCNCLIPAFLHSQNQLPPQTQGISVPLTREAAESRAFENWDSSLMPCVGALNPPRSVRPGKRENERMWSLPEAKQKNRRHQNWTYFWPSENRPPVPTCLFLFQCKIRIHSYSFCSIFFFTYVVDYFLFYFLFLFLYLFISLFLYFNFGF